MKQEGKEFSKLLDGLTARERIGLMGNRDYKYLQCAFIKAQQTEGNIFDGFRCLNMEAGEAELETISKYGAVFINPAGGHTHGIETVQFLRRKQLVFPCFERKDIRVKRFEGGRHWYAYVGDIQVRNGNKLKWDTEKEARQAAEMLVAE